MHNSLAENSLADGVAAPARNLMGGSCYHLITSEYPPQNGGVSDYSRLLAEGLAACGDEVHVWCPHFAGSLPHDPGVQVHRKLGGFSRRDLQLAGDALDAFPAPRRLLVQWVPHGYRYRSMNVGFCWWLYDRAKRNGDRIELMVHEPFLSFRWGAWRQNGAALVHRLMTMLLLRAAERVWISIPAWEARLRPYRLGRRMSFAWLPIFSNVPVANNAARTSEIREQCAAPGRLVIGHFGTFNRVITDLLEPILVSLAAEPEPSTLLLMGEGSQQFRARLVERHPRLEARVQATGKLPPEELSWHLAACDLLIQPYPDGVSSRRTSFMAGLAHAKPMLATSGELTESLWQNAEGVRLSRCGDTAAFVQNVRVLARNTEERLRAGQAAGRLYQERFDSSHIINTLRQAIKDSACGF